MNKKSWFLLTSACIIGFGSLAYGTSVAADSSKRGLDHTGHYTEEPRVKYTGGGDVSVRFAEEESPQLAKWWDGRITVNCPVGYRFKVVPATGSEHEYHEQAKCVFIS